MPTDLPADKGRLYVEIDKSLLSRFAALAKRSKRKLTGEVELALEAWLAQHSEPEPPEDPQRKKR